MQLDGKYLVVGMTGGIAAYKVCELVRRLQDEGTTVQVVMTAGAQQFVTATTMQALSGRPVETDQWKSSTGNAMPHIELTRNADAVIVAPATADFLAKLAHGLADDLLTALALARVACCPRDERRNVGQPGDATKHCAVASGWRRDPWTRERRASVRRNRLRSHARAA
jgi:phosphopantothenoylcysteine synthetase/decarboxylase